MRRRFAGCCNAVVTAAAITNDANVIEIGRHPAGCRMAVVAVIAAGYVRGCLARRDRAVVAGSASTHHLCMIDGQHGCKCDHAMAVLANVGREDMRVVLAGRVGAVMAAHAVARDIDMVEVRRSPGHGRVAIVTGVTARNMCRRFAGRDTTVVAGLTSANDLRVIHHNRRCPKIDAVTIFANGGR